MQKSLFKSKTFYSNLVLALLPLFPGISDVVAKQPEVLGYAFAVVNVVLRLISKDKVYLA